MFDHREGKKRRRHWGIFIFHPFYTRAERPIKCTRWKKKFFIRWKKQKFFIQKTFVPKVSEYTSGFDAKLIFIFHSWLILTICYLNNVCILSECISLSVEAIIINKYSISRLLPGNSELAVNSLYLFMISEFFSRYLTIMENNHRRSIAQKACHYFFFESKLWSANYDDS